LAAHWTALSLGQFWGGTLADRVAAGAAHFKQARRANWSVSPGRDFGSYRLPRAGRQRTPPAKTPAPCTRPHHPSAAMWGLASGPASPQPSIRPWSGTWDQRLAGPPTARPTAGSAPLYFSSSLGGGGNFFLLAGEQVPIAAARDALILRVPIFFPFSGSPPRGPPRPAP